MSTRILSVYSSVSIMISCILALFHPPCLLASSSTQQAMSSPSVFNLVITSKLVLCLCINVSFVLFIFVCCALVLETYQEESNAVHPMK